MQGKIVTWNDSRGFGFIQPDDGSAEVFFHVSAVRNAARRPQIGERVEFVINRDSSGRLKADGVKLLDAAPDGAKPAPRPRTRRPAAAPARKRFAGLAVLVLLFVAWLLTMGPLNGLFAPTDSSPQVEASIQREIDNTLALIRQGGPYPHSQDGTIFQNRERHLPEQPRGYYHEYTVRTPGLSDRGPRRIVTGGNPPVIYYYTEDHYRSFRVLEVKP